MSQIDLTKAESDWVEAMVLGAAFLRGDLAGAVLAGAFIGYVVWAGVSLSVSRHQCTQGFGRLLGGVAFGHEVGECLL